MSSVVSVGVVRVTARFDSALDGDGATGDGAGDGSAAMGGRAVVGAVGLAGVDGTDGCDVPCCAGDGRLGVGVVCALAEEVVVVGEPSGVCARNQKNPATKAASAAALNRPTRSDGAERVDDTAATGRSDTSGCESAAVC
jgi:hypothetical protein